MAKAVKAAKDREQPRIQQYFPIVQGAGLDPRSERADMLDHSRESPSTLTIQTAQTTQTQRAVRMSLEALQITPQSPQMTAVVAGRLPLQSGEMESGSLKVEDLKALIQALPTRADIEAFITKVEEAHYKELQQVRVGLQVLTERVADGEATSQTLEQRVTVLERDRLAQMDTTVALQIQLEDLKDRSRRNNLRLRGIPEAMGQENLQDVVISIFQKILEDTIPQTWNSIESIEPMVLSLVTRVAPVM